MDNASPSANAFRLENFFELSADMLCIAGFDGYFKKVNPAFLETMGYSEEELMQQPVNSFVHPEDQEITEQYRDGLRQNVPLLHFENRYVTKKGEVIWLSWTSMPSIEEKLVYAIAKDVTYKKQLEGERNQLITELTHMNEKLKTFSYTSSHDLRSPVNNLLSIFNFLDINKIKDKETMELVGVLKSSAFNLKEKLNTYVEALQNKEGLQPRPRKLSLQKTVRSVKRTLKTLIKSTETKIEMNFQDAPEVAFAANNLESVFLNLMSNSIKYAKPGVPPHIKITSKTTSEFIKVTFKDNGQGFDMGKVKDKIFGLNQTFHNNPESKGIGLYLVKNHMESLGGSVEVNSAVNKGTTFTLYFKR